MDKYDVLAIIAPIAAPAAPATLLVNILYADMITEHIAHNVAIGSAILSGIGAEASGMIAAYVGIQAFRKQKWGLMVAAAIAFLSYAIFMAVGISVSQNPLTMVSTIVISIIAYVSVAALTDLRVSSEETSEIANQQINLVNANANLENARHKTLNSEIRKLKVSGLSTGTVHGGQTVGQFSADPDRIAAIVAYWHENPTGSLRDCARSVGCSPMTAGKYKP